MGTGHNTPDSSVVFTSPGAAGPLEVCRKNDFTILLDLDEVITDFIGGAARLWGLTPDETESLRDRQEWDVLLKISQILDRPLTRSEFWEPINNNEQFWVDLELLPWAEDILRVVSSYPWYIVTSPSFCGSSWSGKIRWIKQHFGGSFNKYILTPHKHLLARPGHILIDDSPGNCQSFRFDKCTCTSTGAASILFPTLHNANRHYADNPVGYVEETLREILDNHRRQSEPQPQG